MGLSPSVRQREADGTTKVRSWRCGVADVTAVGRVACSVGAVFANNRCCRGMHRSLGWTHRPTRDVTW